MTLHSLAMSSFPDHSRQTALSAELTTDRTEGELNGGALDLLTEALTGYLDELDESRALCLRHEEATEVCTTPSGLHVTQHVPWNTAAASTVCSAGKAMAGWQQSVFWKTEGQSWAKREQDARRYVGRNLLLIRGVAWEGRPLLLCVSRQPKAGLLRVKVILLSLPVDLPELPVHQAASALRCLEHLLPRKAHSLPLSSLPKRGSLGLREFLMRTTPQNLAASQCFSLGGAGK
jgi:hypothetical protein